MAYRVGVSTFVVWKTLNEEGLYPYHVQRLQHLKAEDLPKRVSFYELFSTDEAAFTRDGIFNFHNTYVWSDEDPHAI